MVRVIFFLLITFFYLPVKAQNEIDSLYAVLSGSLDDSVRVNVLNRLAPNFFYKDPIKTDSLATLAIELSRSANYSKGLATALRFKGISYAIRGHFNQAREYYFEALEILEEVKDAKEKPDLYYAVGITYTETGKYELAEESYKKGLALHKSLPDSLGMANSYVGLSNFHKKINRFNESTRYLDSAAAIYMRLNRPSELSIVRNNQANLHISVNNYPKALEYAQEALRYNEKEGLDQKSAVNYHTIGTIYGSLEDLPKAEEYYWKSYNLKKKLGMAQGMSLSLTNLGAMYLQQKQYKKAKETFLKARNIYDSLGMTCNLPYADLSLGSIFQELGNKDSAYYYLNRSLKGSESCRAYAVTAPVLIRLGEMYQADARKMDAESAFLRAFEIGSDLNMTSVKQNAAFHLYTLYKKTGNPLDAFKYLEISSTLKDSLYNEENTRKIARLESKYEFDKEKALLSEKFERENLIQKTEVEKQILMRDTAIIIASLLLALVIGTVIFYFKLKHKNQLLALRNKEITSQKEKLEQLNQTNEKLLSLLSHDLRSPLHGMQSLITLWRDEYLTHEELEQIASDVEIRIGNLLQFLDNILSWSKNNFSKLEAKRELLDLNQAVQDTILLLQPNADVKNISIKFVPNGVSELAGDEVMLKIIFRNILSNAIKFSNEKGVIDVRVLNEGNTVKVAFTDYGTGMSEHVKRNLFSRAVSSRVGTKSEMGAGIGLFLSQDFVELHGGKIEVHSEEGKGSTFMVCLPRWETE